MLPAAHRIRTAAEFSQTTRRGLKVTRGHVVVYMDSTSTIGPPRLGVITSAAVGGSVVRHRVARRIRGVISTKLAQLPLGTRVVVRALPGAGSDPLLPQQVLEAVEAAERRR